MKSKYSLQEDGHLSLTVGNNLPPIWADIQKSIFTKGASSIL